MMVLPAAVRASPGSLHRPAGGVSALWRWGVR